MFISARKNDYDKRFEECIISIVYIIVSLVSIVYIRIYVVSNLRLKYIILVLIYKIKEL